MLPLYLENYSQQEIADIQKLGYVNTNYDSYGNALISSSSISVSSSVITLPMENALYSDSQIETLYDVTFSEFTVMADKVTSKLTDELNNYIGLYNSASLENQQLSTKLSDISSTIDEVNRNIADQTAIKSTILNLRMKLNQGKTESDFDTTFPYMPLSASISSSI